MKDGYYAQPPAYMQIVEDEEPAVKVEASQDGNVIKKVD